MTASNSTPIPVATVRAGENQVRTAYEHPWAARFCHWLNTFSLFVMAASALQIFRAFPSFGPKIPQRDLLHVPKSLALSGCLCGAFQSPITLAWIYDPTDVSSLCIPI